MKKVLYFIISTILVCSLLSCDLINHKSDFHYTNLLSESIKSGKNLKCTLFEMNFYRETDIGEINISKTFSFLNKLKPDNFIAAPADLPKRPKYKLLLSSDKNCFVINIYNEKYISVFPWDGNYPMDYIDISAVPPANNIYELCNYYFSKNYL